MKPFVSTAMILVLCMLTNVMTSDLATDEQDKETQNKRKRFCQDKSRSWRKRNRCSAQYAGEKEATAMLLGKNKPGQKTNNKPKKMGNQKMRQMAGLLKNSIRNTDHLANKIERNLCQVLRL